MRGLDVWKICLVLSLQNVRSISMHKLANFGLVVGVFCHVILNLFLRIVKLVTQQKLSVSLSDQSPEVMALVVWPWRVMGGRAEGMIRE